MTSLVSSILQIILYTYHVLGQGGGGGGGRYGDRGGYGDRSGGGYK